MSITVSRLVVGIEGIVFAAALMWLAVKFARGFANKLSAEISGIMGLTTSAYILLTVWSVAVNRFHLADPRSFRASCCIGLLVGNLLYWLLARGKAKASAG